MERLPASKFAAVEKRVRERMKLAGNEVESLFIDAGVVKAVKVENIHLPWQRLFEVGFEVKVT